MEKCSNKEDNLLRVFPRKNRKTNQISKKGLKALSYKTMAKISSFKIVNQKNIPSKFISRISFGNSQLNR
jgi:hypothetical protein